MGPERYSPGASYCPIHEVLIRGVLGKVDYLPRQQFAGQKLLGTATLKDVEDAG